MRFRDIVKEHKKKMGKVVNEIQGNFDVLIEQKNTAEPSRLFDCEKIELFENNVMIYKRGRQVFKVWLKKDKYFDLNEAMKDTGIKLYKFDK